jgi:hypothetical protein
VPTRSRGWGALVVFGGFVGLLYCGCIALTGVADYENVECDACSSEQNDTGPTVDTGAPPKDSRDPSDTSADGSEAADTSGATDSGTSIDATEADAVLDSVVPDTGTALDAKDTATDVDSTTADGGTDTGVVDGVGADTAAVDSGTDTVVTDASVGSLLISEIQSRGTGGGNDEFIELYNPTSVSVTFDSTWTIAARSGAGTCVTNAQAIRYTGTGQVIGPHRHLLLTNSVGYDGLAVGDDTYMIALNDTSSVVLNHGTTVIDAVCYYIDASSLANLTSCPGAAYTCEGAPVSNLPHDNSTAGSSNTDVTIERKPGGAAGNGTDTGNSSADFISGRAANAQNLTSPATP